MQYHCQTISRTPILKPSAVRFGRTTGKRVPSKGGPATAQQNRVRRVNKTALEGTRRAGPRRTTVKFCEAKPGPIKNSISRAQSPPRPRPLLPPLQPSPGTNDSTPARCRPAQACPRTRGCAHDRDEPRYSAQGVPKSCDSGKVFFQMPGSGTYVASGTLSDGVNRGMQTLSPFSTILLRRGFVATLVLGCPGLSPTSEELRP